MMLFKEGSYKHESGFTILVDKKWYGNAFTKPPPFIEA